MKLSPEFVNNIHDIGFNKFFLHFWSHLQLQIYRDNYKKVQVPTISFDATGGCCQKLKWNEVKKSGSIYLYEGVTNIDNQSFTVLSMLSEQHDNISIANWLKRWLKCDVKAPKVVIFDQSLALMSALVQGFTQYESLEKYLNTCYSLVILNQKKEIPNCFIRNDINHFIHLISQWSAVKNSRYPNTKQLIIRGMGLLVMCTSIVEAEKILSAIFKIILSKSDGELISTNKNNIFSDVQLTPCAKSKKYLKDLINCSEQIDYLQFDQDDSNNYSFIQENYANDDGDLHNENPIGSFKGWAHSISNKVKGEIEGIEGSTDNAQFLPELESTIIRTMKLFPCWSSIMVNIFGYGTPTASSSRIESNFNHIKNRVFKNEKLPLRVDKFLEILLKYYKGDHLLVNGRNKDRENLDFSDENQSRIIKGKHQSGVEDKNNRQDSNKNSSENEEINRDEYSDQNKNSDGNQNGDYGYASSNYDINEYNRETKYKQNKSIFKNENDDILCLHNNEIDSISDTENEFTIEEENSELDYLKINENELVVKSV